MDDNIQGIIRKIDDSYPENLIREKLKREALKLIEKNRYYIPLK